MLNVLRSIAMYERRICSRTQSGAEEMQRQKGMDSTKVQIKRRVGYGHEHIKEAKNQRRQETTG